jgi:hypothetical protein
MEWWYGSSGGMPSWFEKQKKKNLFHFAFFNYPLFSLIPYKVNLW